MREFFPRLDMPVLKGVAEWYYEWMRHPPYDPWWEWAELTNKYDRVSAAVLNVSGWHDEMYGPLGATTNFAGLVKTRGGQARAARTQVVIGPWTHGSDWDATVVGQREMGPAAALDYDALVLDWMDAWLKGAANGVKERPPVRVYAMGAGAWRTGETWPLPAERRSLFLGGAPVPGPRGRHARMDRARRRRAQRPSCPMPRVPCVDPYDAEAGGLDFAPSAPGTTCSCSRRAPLSEDLEVVGPITAEIAIAVDRPDTDLWVKLLDVAPDGTAFNLMSTGLDVLRASYRNKTAHQELLEPGRIYRLTLDTLMTANRFVRGHRIRVALMASFAPNISRNLHTGRLETHSGETARATITVHHGGARGSRLVLPVAAGR